MADQVKLLPYLPVEVVVQILCCEEVSHVDICRLSLTCQRLREICYTEEIWRCKYRQSWPAFYSQLNSRSPASWKRHFQVHYSCIRNVEHFLSHLTETCYKYEEVPEKMFVNLTNFIDGDPYHEQCIIDYLEKLLQNPDEEQTLTKQYYCGKLLLHLRHRVLRKAWYEYMARPVYAQKLEIGTVLVHDWHTYKKSTDIENVSQKLDNLALEVIKELCKYCPDHPVIKHGICDITETHLWNSRETHDILAAINIVLYKKHVFYAEEYTSMDLLDINKVMSTKRCLRWILTVIYQTVARRLGVLLQPVPPFMQLLRWQEHPQEEESYKQYTYLNTNENGRFLSETQRYHIHYEDPNFPPKTWFHNIASKLLRMGRTGESSLMVRNYLKLTILLDPDDLDMLAVWAECNLRAQINLDQVMLSAQKLSQSNIHRYQCLGEKLNRCILEELSKNVDDKPIKPKRRADYLEVEFSVGLIMKHKRYDYMCVVTGWDRKCMASLEWIQRMGVDRLERKDHQPFYNVLVNDGSSRYAAQESLEMPTHGEVINHMDIGRYFQKYCDIYYLPNKQSQEEYPDDLAVTLRIIQTTYGCL